MLFRRNPCHWLKPVRIMGCAALNRPILHCIGNNIRNLGIEHFPTFNGIFQFLVNLFRQMLTHHCIVEYIHPKNFGYRNLFTHILFLSFVEKPPLYFFIITVAFPICNGFTPCILEKSFSFRPDFSPIPTKTIHFASHDILQACFFAKKESLSF